MGRSFESVRMGAKDVSARWLKAPRACISLTLTIVMAYASGR